ncbi:hypothetical protein PybrP1_007421 [[Pythium] brassicae (nom. inval.)]|nr:hypothetical protein PybrP1_007421 [[Pythium] brassicae (nom. inval.)]
MASHKEGSSFFVANSSTRHDAPVDAQFNMLESVGQGRDSSFDATQNRFVAGNKFFNYQQFGALRDGGGVQLFSREYCGLLFATAGSSFTYSILRYCMRPTLMNFLGRYISESSAVTECLLSIPTCICLFMGLMSDIYPIAGYRRKSYMVVGALLTVSMLLGLMALSLSAANLADDSGAQSNYIWLGSWVTVLLVSYDKGKSQYHLEYLEPYQVYLIMAVLNLVPVPFIVRNCAETSVRQAEAEALSMMVAEGVILPQQPRVAVSAMDRVRAFVRMCQQRAVWQIVLFLTIVLAATRFYFSNADRALRRFATLDAERSLRSAALKSVAVIAVMVWWKLSWSNSSWRRCMFLGVLWLVVLETARAMLLVHVPAVRTQTFYDLLGCLMGVTDGLVNIFSFIPATEIAENGAEGATIALFLSFRSILAVAMRTSSEKIFTTAVSTSETGKLTMLLLITYGVHAIAFLGVLLLPRQKLDAQQLRVYGGYSSMACGVLFLIYLLSFTYAMTQNLTAMVAMANGDGA